MEAPVLDRRMISRGPGGDTDLVAEASDLQMQGYPAAVKVADRFGRLVTFERISLVRDREGDLLYARYTAGVRRSPAWVQVLHLTIFND